MADVSPHRFSDVDFIALARGDVSSILVAGLRAVVLSKHKLLLAEIGRWVENRAPQVWSTLRHACELLAKAEKKSPAGTAEVLRSPQVGAWLAESIKRPDAIDARYFEAIAVGGSVSAASQLSFEVGGLRLSLTVETGDSPLTRHLARPALAPPEQIEDYRWVLAEAWGLIVEEDRERAAALAAGLNTLVPVTAPNGTPVSATTGWAPGAVALSLSDPLTIAEGLAHEFHHCVLGMVEDFVPLVDPTAEPSLGYAPWRSDPRPVGGRLHGAYAHQAIADFWRRRRARTTGEELFKAEVAFERWRCATPPVVDGILASDALTAEGRLFVDAMREKFAEWQGEEVSPEAAWVAAEANSSHEQRWRLTHGQMAGG